MIHNILEYGAIGDGKTNDTCSGTIQKLFEMTLSVKNMEVEHERIKN